MHTLLSIGDLAEATGVSVETLRIWERRYGKPAALRLPSGHRRYTDEHVRWVRTVVEAIDRGHRPGRIIPLPEADLTRLIDAEGPVLVAESVMDRVRRYDRNGIEEWLDPRTAPLNLRLFLQERAIPLIIETGRAWSQGSVLNSHEEFLVEVITSVFAGIQTKLPPLPDDARRILFATLPGEVHALGIQLAAMVARMAGASPEVLGVGIPTYEIVQAVEDRQAAAVALSISLASGGMATDLRLEELCSTLPADVRIVIGGSGAKRIKRNPDRVEICTSLDEFEAWTILLRGAKRRVAGG